MISNVAFQAQWKSAIQPLSLFRLHTAVILMRGDVAYVDRIECEKLMRDSTIDVHISWSCAQLSDALRHMPRIGLESRYVRFSDAQYETVVTYITIPNFHSDIQELSYFSELSSLKDTMQYLLSKTLNQRCQSRKVGEVSLRCFDASSLIARQLKRIILCAILGNYTTSSAKTRPRPECTRVHPSVYRVILYTLMNEERVDHNGWFKHMLRDGAIAVLYCLREYLLFAIQDNPGLCEVLRDLLRLTEFTSIVANGMQIVRSYFDNHLFEPTSSMSQSIFVGEQHLPSSYGKDGKEIPLRLPWCVELKGQLAQCQKSILGISYRRPKRHLFQCFDTVRKKLEMIVNPWLHSIQPVIDEAIEDNEDDDVYVNPQDVDDVMPIHDDQEIDQLLHLHISEPQLRAIQVTVNVIMDNCRTDALREFVPYLRHFGVSPDTIQYTLTLNTPMNEDDVLSDEKLRDRLLYLRANQPHAYNLMQIATRMISDRQRMRSVSVLPLHYWRNQISAIQSRFVRSASSNCILNTMIYFVYCDVCGTVYSLLRDFNSVYKQSYTYGYRDAVVDYDTDDIYCKNKKASHLGKCGSMPLIHVLLLGNVIQYQNKTILLCPQLGCGMPMVLNTIYCAYNERGVACCDCTRKMFADQHTNREKELMSRFVADLEQEVSCSLCDRQLWMPSHLYWFPHNVIICRGHSNTSTTKRFNQTLTQNEEEIDNMTSCDVRRVLLRVATVHSDDKRVAIKGKL